MAKTVVINCKGSGFLTLDELKPFQKNLKSMTEKNYAKLKKLIESMGFSFPLFVWTDRQNGANYIIDGHQRVRTLQKMREENYKIPPLPVAYVNAPNFDEAKKKLMAGASQFGDVDRQGLYEFLNDNNWDFKFLDDNFTLPDLDFESFRSEFFDDPGMPNPKEGKEKEPQNILSLDNPPDIDPFGILDTRTNGWKQREKLWAKKGATNNAVVFELVLRWFAIKGHSVLDANVTDPTTGIVAKHLGLDFFGLCKDDQLLKELNDKRYGKDMAQERRFDLIFSASSFDHYCPKNHCAFYALLTDYPITEKTGQTMLWSEALIIKDFQQKEAIKKFQEQKRFLKAHQFLTLFYTKKDQSTNYPS